VLAGALITIAANSSVFAAIEPLQRWVRTRSALARRLEQRDDPLAELPGSTDLSVLTGHVTLVGYGRVGRQIGLTLRERGIPFVVAEQNREIVDALRSEGVAAVSGDAALPEVLIQAHVARAAVLVIALPDTLHVRRMVEVARQLNPGIEVVLRTHNEEEAELLRKDGLAPSFLASMNSRRGYQRMSSLRSVTGERRAPDPELVNVQASHNFLILIRRDDFPRRVDASQLCS
jgi:CPA2 family monovalent cation:H+ antiporter-2